MDARIVTGYIPSPGFNTVHLGPVTLRIYGLMIAVGVLAAVGLMRARWRARGGDPDDVSAVATWAVPAGVIGARLYHVATDWKTYRSDPLAAFEIWHGGLGIPGGILLGALVGVRVARRRHLNAAVLLDCAAPALPIAQAIGRLGNWFNQELFGRPTGLPWGLKIDEAHRPPGYRAVSTFHPTFLYEAVWNLALASVLLAIGRRLRLRQGQLFVLYVVGYALGRLGVESLRIDHASLVLGVRINILVSGLVIVGAALVFVARQRVPAREVRADRPTVVDG